MEHSEVQIQVSIDAVGVERPGAVKGKEGMVSIPRKWRESEFRDVGTGYRAVAMQSEDPKVHKHKRAELGGLQRITVAARELFAARPGLRLRAPQRDNPKRHQQ